MSIPDDWPQVLDFFDIPLVIEPSSNQRCSSATLLPISKPDLGEGGPGASPPRRDDSYVPAGRLADASENRVTVAMAFLRHPETMKTCSDAVILAIDASPDKVGIYLVP